MGIHGGGEVGKQGGVFVWTSCDIWHQGSTLGNRGSQESIGNQGAREGGRGGAREVGR